MCAKTHCFGGSSRNSSSSIVDPERSHSLATRTLSTRFCYVHARAGLDTESEVKKEIKNINSTNINVAIQHRFTLRFTVLQLKKIVVVEDGLRLSPCYHNDGVCSACPAETGLSAVQDAVPTSILHRCTKKHHYH
jgi:hypothetical protein